MLNKNYATWYLKFCLCVFAAMIFVFGSVFSEAFAKTEYTAPEEGGEGGGGGGVVFQKPASIGPVKVVGRQLFVKDVGGVYQPYFIKGVDYSGTPIGRFYGDWGNNMLDDPAVLNRDFSLLQQMNANTIRLYGGNNIEVTLADTENPCSPWYQRWGNIGSFKTKITNRTLDLANAYGIKVIAGFSLYTPGPWCDGSSVQYNPPAFLNPSNSCYAERRQDLINRFRSYVHDFKNHSAILFWAIGNENDLYIPPDYAASWYSLVNELAAVAYMEEGPSYHPVAVVNGGTYYIGNPASDGAMCYLDIWGLNAYRVITFGALFSEFAAKTNKPLWIAEYGADAWHTNSYTTRWDGYQDGADGYEDELTQAQWDSALWDEIVQNNNITMGATLMAYSDEWWKPYEWMCDDLDGNGRCDPSDTFFYGTQEKFGFGPTDTSCPRDGVIDWYPEAPDNFFNEEWWGVMSISRPIPDTGGPDIMDPRQVYYALKGNFSCYDMGRYYAGPENGKSCDGTSACCLSANMKTNKGVCISNCPRRRNNYVAPVE